MNDLISKLGDWNPQFFREIKGRLKGFNIAIASWDIASRSNSSVSLSIAGTSQ